MVVGAVSSEPVSHVDKQKKRRILEPRISPRISRFRIFDRLGVVVETAGNAIEKDFNPPHFEGLKTPGKRHLTAIS